MAKAKLSRDELHRIICEANEAKERLYNVALKLEEAGYIQKAKSAKTLVYSIEAWQRRADK